MRENADPKNSEYGHSSCSGHFGITQKMCFVLKPPRPI